MVAKVEPAEDYGKLKLFIGGEWKHSSSEDLHPALDPGKGKAIAQVPFSLKEEVVSAVEAAQRAYDKWREVPITDRVKYLFKVKDSLQRHFDKLAFITSQNHGKTLVESRGDLQRTIDNVDVAISVAHTLSKGEAIDQIAPGIDESMLREPLGVFSIICPFNFPLMIPFWFIPYAIVLGDTVILKPSEITPMPMQWVAEIMREEVGLPPGVLNVVHGGREVAESLITHEDVRGVAFVGSTLVAKSVYKLAGQHGKRAIVQGGAKNSIIVMPDAELDRSIAPIVSSFLGNAGQRCLAGANLIAVGDVHEKLVREFTAAATRLRVGYGLDETTEMGPVISSKAKARIIAYVEEGESEGAKMVADGRHVRVQEYPDGFYLGPTIFEAVTPDMKISREEIFGPVVSILSTASLDAAVEIVNKGTNYGNMACIFTTSGKLAREFRRRVEAGNIGINLGVAAPTASFPFGGRRESFFGILHSQVDAVDFFTDKKIIISRW